MRTRSLVRLTTCASAAGHLLNARTKLRSTVWPLGAPSPSGTVARSGLSAACAGLGVILRDHGIATATRRMSNRTIATPGADQVVTGGMALRACSSVSNSTNPKPWRSTGSIQYPATKPNAVRTRGSSSLVNTAAAAGASAGSMVKCISAACIGILSLVSSQGGKLHSAWMRCFWPRETTASSSHGSRAYSKRTGNDA
jgi:hypothetical protein